MLAWIHQATASEHEFLQGLFGVGEGNRRVGEERIIPKVGEGVEGVEEEEGTRSEREMLTEGLDRDLEGLGRPLKVRLELSGISDRC
jgi:hypothetical protein